MSKTKEIDKKDPFRGSIDVRRDPIFEEEYSPSRLQWRWSNGTETIEGELNPSCFTKQLKQLFIKFEVDYKTIMRESIVLKSDIPPLRFDKLSYNGPNHIRIYFSGSTPTEFEDKHEEIVAFMDERNIPHKTYCPWVCPDNAKQYELTTKFLTGFEKLR